MLKPFQGVQGGRAEICSTVLVVSCANATIAVALTLPDSKRNDLLLRGHGYKKVEDKKAEVEDKKVEDEQRIPNKA